METAKTTKSTTKTAEPKSKMPKAAVKARSTAKAKNKSVTPKAKSATAPKAKTSAAAENVSKVNRDYSKYTFHGETVGKRQLVQRLIKDYTANHPETTSEDLRAIFGKGIIKPLGKKRPNEENMLKRLGVSSLKTFFTAEDQLVKVKGDAQYIAIFNQWPKNAFDKFMEKVKGLGYTVQKDKKSNELVVA